MLRNYRSAALCTLPFLALFVLGPLTQLDFLARVPGDIGDGRLNAYFLEHIWQVLIGRADSFVHMPFFAPNLWVGAFSDLHWGSSVIYILARTGGLDPIASYQLWWLFAYVANFVAALVAFRLLRFDLVPATMAALFFTFALPVAAHTYSHAQLSYRFGAPLALALYIRFLLDGQASRFLLALFFTIWQIYATIYIGFFTLIALLFVTLAHFRFFIAPVADTRARVRIALGSFRGWAFRSALIYWGAVSFLLALFALAFVPYLIPADVYGSSRGRSEIWLMLPRVASYFYTSASTLWTMEGRVFENIPMLHEHQMFIGIVGLVMVIWGAIKSSRHHAPEIARLLWVPLVAIMVVTLNSDGVSLWAIFADLPLASAIRAMTRIDLVMVFFAAGLIAVLAQQALQQGVLARAALAVAAVLLMVEATQLRTNTTSVVSIRQTLEFDIVSAAQNMPDDAVLFIAQSHNNDVVGPQPWYAMEIRAMWVGAVLGVPVLNGYSGKSPDGYNVTFADDCDEAGRRIGLAYHLWPELNVRYVAMSDMIARVHLVGFDMGCDIDEVIRAAGEVSEGK